MLWELAEMCPGLSHCSWEGAVLGHVPLAGVLWRAWGMVSWSVPRVGVPVGFVWGGRGVSRLERACGDSHERLFSRVLCALTLMWPELPMVPD